MTIEVAQADVVPQPTTIDLTSSTASPTWAAETVHLDAIVSPFDQLAGRLDFYDGDQLIGNSLIGFDGTAAFGISTLSAGLHHLTAHFGGDDLLLPSVSNEILHTVNAVDTVTSISGPSTVIWHSPFGAQITVNAVPTSPIPPEGTVRITLDQSQVFFDTVTVGIAGFSGSNLAPGHHTLTASFSSDLPFTESNSAPFSFDVLPIPTSISISTPVKWLNSKQSSTLQVGLPNDATGRVTFKDGKKNLGAATASNGEAALARKLPVGPHKITASYSGDEHYQSSTSAPVKITVAALTTIDLMIVYTTKVSSVSGGALAIAQIARDAVNATNQAYLDSQIPLVLRLVYMAPVKYRESGKIETDLKRLSARGDGYMDEVHRYRDAYAADLVCLFESDGDLGGAGWQMRDINSSSNPDYGFSVVLAGEAGAPYYNLAHELGHNLGATHDAQNQPGKGATSFSNGWRFTGDDGVLYHDVMSYDPGQTIPYYSNPRIKYQNVPIGNARTADAARTITITAPYIANFRRPHRRAHR